MATLKLLVTTGQSKETMRQNYERTTSSSRATVQSIAQLLEGVLSGTQSGSPPTVASSVKEYAVRASGTFTMTSVIATDAVVINGVTFTAVASGATGNQFNVGLTDALTAANLVAAINGSVTALIAGYVTAAVTSTVDSPAVVTVSSTDYGIYGNQVTFVSNDATIVASGSGRLASGAVDSGAKSYTF